MQGRKADPDVMDVFIERTLSGFRASLAEGGEESMPDEEFQAWISGKLGPVALCRSNKLAS